MFGRQSTRGPRSGVRGGSDRQLGQPPAPQWSRAGSPSARCWTRPGTEVWARCLLRSYDQSFGVRPRDCWFRARCVSPRALAPEGQREGGLRRSVCPGGAEVSADGARELVLVQRGSEADDELDASSLGIAEEPVLAGVASIQQPASALRLLSARAETEVFGLRPLAPALGDPRHQLRDCQVDRVRSRSCAEPVVQRGRVAAGARTLPRPRPAVMALVGGRRRRQVHHESSEHGNCA